MSFIQFCISEQVLASLKKDHKRSTIFLEEYKKKNSFKKPKQVFNETMEENLMNPRLLYYFENVIPNLLWYCYGFNELNGFREIIDEFTNMTVRWNVMQMAETCREKNAVITSIKEHRQEFIAKHLAKSILKVRNPKDMALHIMTFA